MTSTNIIGLCGSLHKGSSNRKLLNEAVQSYGPGEFEEILLDLPLYNGDTETDKGCPASVETLAAEIQNAEGVIVTSPEYNKGISGVLKNALDWISRVPGSVWKDKPVVIMSAAAGRSGWETAQYMMRHCFAPFGARLVAGPLVCIASANEQFDETKRLLSDRHQNLVAKGIDNLRRKIEMQKNIPRNNNRRFTYLCRGPDRGQSHQV